MSDDGPMAGVARYLGSLPAEKYSHAWLFEVGDIELYQVRPPLAGYHVVACAQSRWAMRMRVIGDDSPAEDPVSTTLFGVSGGEAANIDRDRQLHDPINGRTPRRALADLGYSVG